MKFTIIDWTFS